jgi:haloalkane dehalogenase
MRENFKTMQVPGGKMAWRESGAGDPVVLVHGTPSSSNEWRAIMQELQKTHRVLACDHLGFGQSERPADLAVYTLPWHAENFAAWLDAQGLERLHLVVHDFGGPIALPWAFANAARLASLTIVQSWAWSFREDPAFVKTMKWMDSWLMKWLYRSWNFSARVMVKLSWGTRRPLSKDMHAQFLKQFPTRDSRAGTWGFARALVKEQAYLDGLRHGLPSLDRAPTLIVWGLADAMVKPYNLANWKSALPHAKTVELKDVGHFPQLEAPEELLAALQRHLACPSRLRGATYLQARR